MTKPSTTRMRVAAAVRAETARAGVTRTQLAHLLGVDPATVSRRLNGRIGWTVDDLDRVAEYLGVPLATLLGADERQTVGAA